MMKKLTAIILVIAMLLTLAVTVSSDEEGVYTFRATFFDSVVGDQSYFVAWKEDNALRYAAINTEAMISESASVDTDGTIQANDIYDGFYNSNPGELIPHFFVIEITCAKRPTSDGELLDVSHIRFCGMDTNLDWEDINSALTAIYHNYGVNDFDLPYDVKEYTLLYAEKGFIRGELLTKYYDCYLIDDGVDGKNEFYILRIYLDDVANGMITSDGSTMADAMLNIIGKYGDLPIGSTFKVSRYTHLYDAYSRDEFLENYYVLSENITICGREALYSEEEILNLYHKMSENFGRNFVWSGVDIVRPTQGRVNRED